jgi:hypothetical protein
MSGRRKSVESRRSALSPAPRPMIDKEPVPEANFLGEQFQKEYVAKYGEDEKGYWKPEGSL